MDSLETISRNHPCYFAIIRIKNDVALFARRSYSGILISALNHFVHFEKMQINGYVIHPEGAQLLFQTEKEAEELIRRLIICVSRQMKDFMQNNEAVQRNHLLQLLQKENDSWLELIHLEVVDSPKVAGSILHDIHHLPVREFIAVSPAAYVLSSASAYSESRNPVLVSCIK
ncbi:MAG: hypothetical protein U0X76_08655 [Bacteroidia bacterium]